MLCKCRFKSKTRDGKRSRLFLAVMSCHVFLPQFQCHECGISFKRYLIHDSSFRTCDKAIFPSRDASPQHQSPLHLRLHFQPQTRLVFECHVNIIYLPPCPPFSILLSLLILITRETNLHPSPTSPHNLPGRTHISLLSSHLAPELGMEKGDNHLQRLGLRGTGWRGASICSRRMGTGLACTYTFSGVDVREVERGRGKSGKGK